MKRSDLILRVTKSEKGERLLDTPEKVRQAHDQLIKATESIFIQYENARRQALDLATKRYLD
ncbi:MAG: hypothetical protein GX444_04100 [Myxococcales bacterium]|nr:hypothetical protein [Myxococcales bacterium]